MSIQTEKKFLPVVHALESGCNNEAIPVKHFVEFLTNYLTNQMDTPLHNVNNGYHVCDENGEYFLTPVEILLKAQSLHTADLLVEKKGAEVPDPWKSAATFNTDREYTHYLGLCPHDLWVTVRHNPHVLQERNSAGETIIGCITKAGARKWATETMEKLQEAQTPSITRSH